jgi:phytoene dehydrogenase-like protein
MTENETDQPHTTDIAVVGGGLAGLIAAVDAARAGAQVTLFDTRSPGGRARSADVRGFRFNQGAHALYDTGAARPILQSLGVPLTGGPPAVGRSRLVKGGENHVAPTGPFTLARTSVLGMRGKLVAGWALSRLGAFDPEAWSDQTVDEWIDRRDMPDDAADLVRMLVRIATYTDAPDQLSASVGIGQAAMGLAGVTYLDGGWQGLVDALVAIAKQTGVVVRDHVAVRGVEADGHRWRVEGDESGVIADAVVLAGLAPVEVARLLGSNVDDLGWGGLGPPVQASCLDLGVRRPAPIPALFSVDEPLYLSTHSPPADLAPDGHGVVQLLRYLAPGESPDPDVTRAELQAHASRAGVRPEDIVEQRFLHRMTVAHALPLAASGGLAGRPGVAVDTRPGVFVAGDWVGPVGWLADAAAASGRAAATAAVRIASTVAP